MTSHDDDILDFDFVDDETRELAPPSSRPTARQPGDDDVQPGGRGPRRPHFGGGHGLTPLLRLAALVAFAILVIVLLAVWVQGCAGDDEQTTYGTYLAEIGDVGKDSATIGADLATLLTTPGLAQAELETRLGGLVQQQELDVSRAQDLDPPGPLTPAQAYAVQALQLRVAGLQGMLDTFRATKDSEDAAAAGQQLASMGQRLEASDVVWKDLFQGTADEAMATEGVQGLAAPPSVFVSPGSITSIVPFFVIGFGWAGMVSLTLTPTSWFSPELLTPTSNARSVEIVIFVSVEVVSWTPAGCTSV